MGLSKTRRVGVALMVSGLLVGGLSVSGVMGKERLSESVLMKEQRKLAVEKQKLVVEQKKLVAEKKSIEKDRRGLKESLSRLKSDQAKLKSDQSKLSKELGKLSSERARLVELEKQLKVERDKVGVSEARVKELSSKLVLSELRVAELGKEIGRLEGELLLCENRIEDLLAGSGDGVGGSDGSAPGDTEELTDDERLAEVSKRLSEVDKYKIYYDAPSAELVEEMKKFDLVIVESTYYDEEIVKEIQSEGTLVYGYISVMEVASWNEEYMSKFKEEAFYKRDGERVHYAEWDSYLMDISNDHYREELLAETRREVVDKGFDGVFLDTVGDIDNEFWYEPEEMAKQRAGLVEYLEILRNEDKISTIQNWGFDTLKTTSIDLVDGIMWEGFTKDKLLASKWSQNRIAELVAFEKEDRVAVFTVSRDQSDASAEYARSLGFAHYLDNGDYNEW